MSYPAHILAPLSWREGLRAQDQAVPDETSLLARPQARPLFGAHRHPVLQPLLCVGLLVHLGMGGHRGEG